MLEKGDIEESFALVIVVFKEFESGLTDFGFEIIGLRDFSLTVAIEIIVQ